MESRLAPKPNSAIILQRIVLGSFMKEAADRFVFISFIQFRIKIIQLVFRRIGKNSFDHFIVQSGTNLLPGGSRLDIPLILQELEGSAEEAVPFEIRLRYDR